MGAVASLVLGLLSFIAIPFVTLLPIPFLGTIFGLRAVKAIKASPKELTGLGIARVGLFLSATLFIASIVWKVYDYSTEVPPTYARTSWAQLQPDKKNQPTLPVSPESLELHDTKIFIKGYVYPDDTQNQLDTFVLVPDRGTCCFGGSPPLTHMIEVRLKDPLKVKYSMLQRKLGGVLKVDLKKKPASGVEGVYYQLEADYVR